MGVAGGRLRSSCEGPSQGPMITKRLGLNHKIIECYPPPTHYCHIIKGLFTGASFTQSSWVSCPTQQQKLQDVLKEKAQFESRQALDSYMAGMLELLD